MSASVVLAKPVPQRVGQGGSPERPTSRFLIVPKRLVEGDPIAGWKKREVGRCPNTLGNSFTRPLSREKENPRAFAPTYHVCRASFQCNADAAVKDRSHQALPVPVAVLLAR
jgi:hypothetical protein